MFFLQIPNPSQIPPKFQLSPVTSDFLHRSLQLHPRRVVDSNYSPNSPPFLCLVLIFLIIGGIVDFDDIEADFIRNFLELIYCGETEVPKRRKAKFFKTLTEIAQSTIHHQNCLHNSRLVACPPVEQGAFTHFVFTLTPSSPCQPVLEGVEGDDLR